MKARGKARPRISGAGLTRRALLAVALGGAAARAGRRERPFGLPAVLAASAGPIKLGVLLPYSKVYQQLGEDITSGMTLYLESAGFKAGGRSITMIREDEEIDPQVALRKGRKLIDSVAGVRFTSPRGPFSFDPETHNVIQTVYTRQVREVGQAIHNVVFGSLGVFKDPGA